MARFDACGSGRGSEEDHPGYVSPTYGQKACGTTPRCGGSGIRAMTEALFPQLAKGGIHIATVTVAKSVSPGSSAAKEVADELSKGEGQ